MCSSTDKSKEELETINNATASEFQFCYNVNILLKVHQQNSFDTKANAVVNTGGVLAVGIIKPGDHAVKCHGIVGITKWNHIH